MDPTSDSVLEGLAKDGTMDYAQWPSLLDRILPKLEHIVYSDFPMPSIPLPDSLPSSLKEDPFSSTDEHVSLKREPPAMEEASKEKPSIPEEHVSTKQELPETGETEDIKQDPSLTGEPSAVKRDYSSHSPSSQKQAVLLSNSSVALPAGTLPPPLLSLLHTIQATLRTSFPTAPPHTAQRLAELLIHPTQHYRTLPSYLRALDRIVSVASPASIFPLPNLNPSATTNGHLLNGTSSPSPDPTDKDFIGGAELTEIPWLRNAASPTPMPNGPTSDLRTESTSLIDGPNGAGSVETVTVNFNGISSTSPREDSSTHGITQGELLRQEQEAGIVPVPSPAHSGRVTRSSAAASAAATRAVGLELEEGMPVDDHESVHARGPGIIGMADMGPQAPSSGLAGGLDVEGALGRRGEGEAIASTTAHMEEREEQGKEKDDEKDGHGDVVVTDADGVFEGQGGVDASGKNKGADAVDTTAI